MAVYHSYNEVAIVINNSRQLANAFLERGNKSYGEGYKDAVEDIVDKLCFAFQAGNARFNRKRFLEACGVTRAK